MSVRTASVLSSWLDSVVPGLDEKERDEIEMDSVDEMLDRIKSIKHTIEQNKDALRH